jgi:hypothetical protein
MGKNYYSLSEIEDSFAESFLIDIARTAAINAINENKALHIPITTIENGWVVKKMHDGKVERISKLVALAGPKNKALTKGSILHVKSQK